MIHCYITCYITDRRTTISLPDTIRRNIDPRASLGRRPDPAHGGVSRGRRRGHRRHLDVPDLLEFSVVTGSAAKQAYSREETGRLLGIWGRHLHGWKQQKLVEPVSSY